MIVFITPSDHLEQTNKVMVSPSVTVSHTHIDKDFFCHMYVLWPRSVLYLALLKLCKFTCNEKCFLRSVGACLSVCVCTVGCILSCTAVLDDRDFQLSRVRRQTQGGYKTYSRHSACLSVTKIRGIFITVQNRLVLRYSFSWSVHLNLHPRHF